MIFLSFNMCHVITKMFNLSFLFSATFDSVFYLAQKRFTALQYIRKTVDRKGVVKVYLKHRSENPLKMTCHC
jgi:hypothetical protein